jgi:hypothetical protein
LRDGTVEGHHRGYTRFAGLKAMRRGC